MTSDPSFKVTVVLKGEYLQSDAFYRQLQPHCSYVNRANFSQASRGFVSDSWAFLFLNGTGHGHVPFGYATVLKCTKHFRAFMRSWDCIGTETITNKTHTQNSWYKEKKTFLNQKCNGQTWASAGFFPGEGIHIPHPSSSLRGPLPRSS